MSTKEKIEVLQKMKVYLKQGIMPITQKLLGLLERAGINLSGYGELTPLKEQKGKEMVLVPQKEEPLSKAA